MAPTTHSAFPASSATRLIECPGSYALGIAAYTGRRTTIYSAEGTLAHALSEAAVLTGSDPGNALGRDFILEGFAISPDEQFVEGVQTYVDYINTLRSLGYLVALEIRVSPQVHWANKPDVGIELYGTADCVAYNPATDELAIVDLKFGAGVPVEVAGNDQLRYYAAGAMTAEVVNDILRHYNNPLRVPIGWKPRRVRTVVVQPRAHHPGGPVRPAVYTADEILDFANNRLYDGVVRALADNGQTFKTGKHCRFCPALAHCELHRQEMVEAARQTFMALPPTNEPVEHLLGVAESTATQPAPAGDTSTGDASTNDASAALPQVHLSDTMLAQLMDRVAILKPYIAAIEALAQARSVEKPDALPGWTTTPTQARRVWGEDDPRELRHQLASAGLQPSDYLDEVLLTPAQVQRRVGKKKYDQLVKPFVGRRSSGVKLVPVADPRVRRAITAQEAFGLPGPTTTKGEEEK